MSETSSLEDRLEVEKRPMVAAVIIRDKKMLFVQNIKKGVRLEPPGGKKKPDETPEEAVVREGDEEMGCVVVIKEFIGNYDTHSTEGAFSVDMFLCEMDGDPIEGREPGKIAGFPWLSYDEMVALKEKNEAGDLSVILVPNVVKALDDLRPYLV